MAAVPGVLTSRVAADYDEESRIDDLIARGKYVTASHALQQAIVKARSVDDNGSILRLLALLGRLSIERGDLQKADQAIRAATAAGRHSVWSFWEAMAARENAVLLFARGEYPAAREAALRASRLAKDNNFYKIRIAYTHSLAAVSSLSMGDRSSAARLMEQALKPIPRQPPKDDLYAPRILFAACQFEARSGDFFSAEAHCLRGLMIAENSKLLTRNLALGKLALAEAYLGAGKYKESGDAARQSLEITDKLFGRQHQDAANALQLLALVDSKAG